MGSGTRRSRRRREYVVQLRDAKQKKARLVNLYRGLLKKWPNSATVRRKLRELGG